MKSLLINPNITLKLALKKLAQTGKKCLVVLDNKKKLLGTLTHGDLRASILSGKDLNEKISKLYNTKPFFFFENNYSNKNAQKIFIEKELDLIPIINKKKEVKKIIFWSEVFSSSKKTNEFKTNLPVVIMAGGEGKRMEPFTSILPKPLIPINGKAVIEHIVDKFVEMGISDFHISVNYKSNLIKAYFDDIKNKNYKIKYLKEKKPLGTAGSLSLFKKKLNGPIILTNSDILINADLIDLLNYHSKKKSDITLVASVKDYTIPYGVCELHENGQLLKINEKPTHNFLVNTGLYVINSKVLKLIPKNKKYDLTDLLKKGKKEKMKICVYPISDNLWTDVGQWTEYRKATRKFINQI